MDYCEKFELRITFDDGDISIDVEGEDDLSAWQLYGVLQAAMLEIARQVEEDRLFGPHTTLED